MGRKIMGGKTPLRIKAFSIVLALGLCVGFPAAFIAKGMGWI